MNSVSKILIGSGILLILIGLIWQVGGRFLNLGQLGRLPGDIVIEKENFRFYFPIVTSILLSLLVSGILFLINYLRR